MATLREVKKRMPNLKPVIFGVAMLLGLIATSGQAAAKLYLGPKAGLAMSKFSGEDIAGAKWRTGFTGGVSICFEFNNEFGLQTEVLHVTKGNKLDVGLTSKHDYIAFPFLLRYVLPVSGSLKPNIFTGVEAAFNHSAKLVNGAEIDIDSGIKDFDIGYVIGFGCAAHSANGAVTFDIRYTRGLNKLDDTATGFDLKHNTISFMAGYVFAFGH